MTETTHQEATVPNTVDDDTTLPSVDREKGVRDDGTADEATDEQQPDTAEDDGQRPKNREERYRKERAALKAENDELRARLEKRDRLEVERVAAEHLADPADLWLSGNDVSAYLTDDGDVDADKISEAVKALIAERPHWGKAKIPAAPPASTVTARDKIEGGTPTPTWSEVLRQPKREK